MANLFEEIRIEFIDYPSGLIYVNAEDTSAKIKIAAHLPNEDQSNPDLVLKWTLIDRQEKKVLFKNKSICPGSRNALLVITYDLFGRELELNVSAFCLNKSALDGNNVKIWMDKQQPLFLSSLQMGSTTFTVKCREKRITKVEWETPKDKIYSASIGLPQHRDERVVIAKVTLSGCYGEIITARKKITENDFYVVELEQKIKVLSNEAIIYFRETETELDVTKDHHLNFFLSLYDSTGTPLMLTYGGGEVFTSFFQYTFKGSLRVVDLRQMPVQPVMVGYPHIEDNNFMPCKYEEIGLTYTTDKEGELIPMTIFKEYLGVNRNFIYLIGGLRQLTFSFKEYTVDECKITDPIKKHKKKIRLTKDGKTSEIPLKDDSLTIDVEYNYGVDGWFAPALLRYLWPLRDNLLQQRAVMLIETCRHTNQLAINMYPNIEWKLAFVFSLENPLAYTAAGLKNNRRASLIYNEALQKTIKSGEDKKSLEDGTTPGQFGVSLKATVETEIKKEEFEIGKDFEAKIKKFYNALLELKKWADGIKDSVGGGAKKTNTVLGKLGKELPFSFEIMSPKIGVDLSWKIEVDEKLYQPAVIGTFSFIADPLIGAEFTIDLLALTATAAIPIFVRKILDTFGMGLKKLKEYATIELVFYGKLEVVIDAFQINTSTGELTGGGEEQMIRGEMGVKFIMSIKVKGKFTTPVCKVRVEFAAEAQANAYFGGTIKLDTDEDGLFIDITGKFSGLVFSAKIEGRIGIFSGSIEFESEPLFESGDIPLKRFYLTK